MAPFSYAARRCTIACAPGSSQCAPVTPSDKALLLGLLAAFALVHVHSTLEWVLRQTQPMYLFFLLSGLMVAVGNMLAAPPAPAARS